MFRRRYFCAVSLFPALSSIQENPLTPLFPLDTKNMGGTPSPCPPVPSPRTRTTAASLFPLTPLSSLTSHLVPFPYRTVFVLTPFPSINSTSYRKKQGEGGTCLVHSPTRRTFRESRASLFTSFASLPLYLVASVASLRGFCSTLSDEQKANTIRGVAVDASTLLGRKVVSVDRTDDAKFVFEDGSWILARLSGTEPVVRLYVEADSAAATGKLTREASEWILNGG